MKKRAIKNNETLQMATGKEALRTLVTPRLKIIQNQLFRWGILISMASLSKGWLAFNKRKRAIARRQAAYQYRSN